MCVWPLCSPWIDWSQTWVMLAGIGAKARCLQCNRQAGEPCAHDADVDVQIERKPRALARRSFVRSAGRACRNFAHIVFLRIDLALVTLS